MNVNDPYPNAAEAVALAESRGYDPVAHAAAIADDAECGCGGSDDISLTHPTNWLTEDEVGRLWDGAFPGIPLDDPDALHCDLCDVVETAADLTPDWNGETGNHLSCERKAVPA